MVWGIVWGHCLGIGVGIFLWYFPMVFSVFSVFSVLQYFQYYSIFSISGISGFFYIYFF